MPDEPVPELVPPPLALVPPVFDELGAPPDEGAEEGVDVAGALATAEDDPELDDGAAAADDVVVVVEEVLLLAAGGGVAAPVVGTVRPGAPL